MTALRPFLFLHIERSPPIPGRALFRAAVYPLRVRHEHPASNASAPAPTYPSRVQRIRPRVQAILFGSAATIAVSTPGPPQKRCTARTRNLLYFGISTTYGGSMLMCEV